METEEGFLSSVVIIVSYYFLKFAFYIGDLAEHDWCSVIDSKQPYKVHINDTK